MPAPPMPTLTADDDNAAPRYLRHRADLETNAAYEAMVRSVQGLPPGGEAAPPAPPDQQQPDSPPAATAALQKAGAVASDVARGVVEAPMQALGGLSDAVHHAFMGLDSLGDWLNTHVADLTVPVPKTGVDQLDALIANPAAAIAGPADPATRGIGPAKTVTGDLVRNTAQFLSAFIPAFGAMRGAGAGNVAAGMTAGAAADFAVFDPMEGRLSNLWQQLGLPANVLTDYLAAQPGDSEIEGRFKNALEGAGLGVLTDGVRAAAGFLRSLRSVRPGAAPAAEDAAALARAQYGSVDGRDFMILGDPGRPLLEVRPAEAADGAAKLDAALAATETGVPDATAAAGLARSGEAGGQEIFVNFAAIQTADDVKNVIGQMTDAFAGSIDEARRGVQSNAETVALAEELGLSVGDVLARRRGQPFNAEEALAARQLWAASGEKLMEAAKRAASPNAGAVDQWSFRKMLAIHYAIQAEVIGARTETARALQSWAIPAGGGVEKARAIQLLMDSMGGPQASAEMARKLLDLENATPQAVNQFVRKAWGAATVDAVKEVWINGLLSSPKTHVVNMVSNSAFAVQQIAERWVAEGIGRATGSNAVAPGEAAALTFGYVTALKDAFRLAAKTLRTGESAFAAETGQIDLRRHGAVSSLALGIGGDTTLGRTVDLIGTVARVPGRLLTSEDEFFKTVGYRGELAAQSWRQATAEGLTGEAFARRTAELMTTAPENLRIAASDAALYQTFTGKPGWFGQGLMRLRDGGGPMSFWWLLAPFLRTPVNLARAGFERTPFAPLVGQWRADIAAGGARRDLALARMSTGTAIMAVVADFADGGLISGQGPDDTGEREALRRQGWQPYSIRVGDRWVSYNRLDPLGMTFGLAANMTEAMKRGEVDADDVDEWQEVMGMAVTAVSQAALSKRYLSGVSQFVEMQGDPQRYGESFINQAASSFVPGAALMGGVERTVDPTLREANGPWQAIQSRIAGLSARLQPRRNLWGEEIKVSSGLGWGYDFISPLASSAHAPTPIDSEIVRLALDVRRIAKKTSFEGVPVDLGQWPEVHDAYVRLAGNELEAPRTGMGARDFLNAVVSGETAGGAWQRMSDAARGDFIRNTIADYRKLARAKILTDPAFAEFRSFWHERKVDRAREYLPAIGVQP